MPPDLVDDGGTIEGPSWSVNSAERHAAAFDKGGEGPFTDQISLACTNCSTRPRIRCPRFLLVCPVLEMADCDPFVYRAASGSLRMARRGISAIADRGAFWTLCSECLDCTRAAWGSPEGELAVAQGALCIWPAHAKSQRGILTPFKPAMKDVGKARLAPNNPWHLRKTRHKADEERVTVQGLSLTRTMEPRPMRRREGLYSSLKAAAAKGVNIMSGHRGFSSLGKIGQKAAVPLRKAPRGRRQSDWQRRGRVAGCFSFTPSNRHWPVGALGPGGAGPPVLGR